MEKQILDKQRSSFEIKTLNDLVDAIHTNSGEPLQGPSGVYLRWRAGHGGEYPCDGQVVRFHVFVGNACETSKVFSVSPTPILELDLKLLSQVSEHVLDLSIKIECFVF